MKITHICIAAPFSDGYSYQENLLTKFHTKLGHEVSVIATDFSLNQNGKFEMQKNTSYINDDNVEVHRIKLSRNPILKKLKITENYSDKLEALNPDIIFIHGSQFLSITPIINYFFKNKNRVRIYCDNHADFSNSALNFFSRIVLHKIIWRITTQKLCKVVKKFYGVLPARVEFLKKIYRVPESKLELLYLGGDDDLVDQTTPDQIKQIKQDLMIAKDQIVLITGGKIDLAKQEVLYLMEYVRKRKNLFLIIFGSIVDELKEDFNNLLSTNMNYYKWVSTEESYRLISVADLVVFPGRHSVYWEQVVSQQKPMVVKYWEGTTHIDIGGNVTFIDYSENKKQSLYETMDHVLNKDKLKEMSEAAKKIEYRDFLYSEIAKKSIDEEVV